MNDGDEIVPKEQSLFPLTAQDILEGAFDNLDERQARDVSKKAADEALRLEVQKRAAQQRSGSAQEEIRNVIDNANLLDQRGGDYQIDSTFETATGTTNVKIAKSRSVTMIVIITIAGLLLLAILMAVVLTRS
jgi:hypothetical protein